MIWEDYEEESSISELNLALRILAGTEILLLGPHWSDVIIARVRFIFSHFSLCVCAGKNIAYFFLHITMTPQQVLSISYIVSDLFIDC